MYSSERVNHMVSFIRVRILAVVRWNVVWSGVAGVHQTA